MPAPLPLPEIHPNGSGQNSLLGQMVDAVNALKLAADAMRESYPHMRDYYTLDPAIHSEAVKQHQDRISRIESLIEEYESIAVAIASL